MPFVIQQIRPAGRSARADEATAFALTSAAIKGDVVYGLYLEWSDPNARNGMGDERWTNDLAKAQRFATHEAAFECWRAQSTVRPIRPDGKANRPMTAFSVTIEQVKS